MDSESPGDGKGIRIKKQSCPIPAHLFHRVEEDGSSIHSVQRRLEHWAEHFEEQFNWPAAKEPILGTREPLWSVNIEEPTLEEVQREVSLLKRDNFVIDLIMECS